MPAMLAMGAVSLIGGISGKKSAKKDRREAMRIQAETLAFNKQRYDDYKSLYGDLEKDLVAGAQEGVEADIGGVTSRAVGDIEGRFAGDEAARTREMQRYGINPNSGRAESMARESGTQKALASAALINANRENERVRADQETWDRKRDVTTLGVNQMNMAAGNYTASAGGMAAANMTSANQKTASANQLFGIAGLAAGQYLGGLNWGGNPSSTPDIGATSQNIDPKRIDEIAATA